MTLVETSRVAMLRARTKASHARIETVPALSRLMSPDLRVAEYVAVLDALHAFHRAFDPQITEALRNVPDAGPLIEQSRLPRLRRDLSWFDVVPSALTPPVPRLTSAAAGLGALYVIEGSILGGRIIARHLASSLGVQDGSGSSYYGGTSAEAARAGWQALCDVLERFQEFEPCPLGPDQSRLSTNEVMADTACETFDSLDRWMRRIRVAQMARPLAEAVAS